MEFHNPGFIIEVQNFINYNGLGATWGEILSAKQFFLFLHILGPPLLKTHHVYLSAANKCVDKFFWALEVNLLQWSDLL